MTSFEIHRVTLGVSLAAVRRGVAYASQLPWGPCRQRTQGPAAEYKNAAEKLWPTQRGGVCSARTARVHIEDDAGDRSQDAPRAKKSQRQRSRLLPATSCSSSSLHGLRRICGERKVLRFPGLHQSLFTTRSSGMSPRVCGRRRSAAVADQ